MLNKEYFHSARDERSKVYMESLGLNAINNEKAEEFISLFNQLTTEQQTIVIAQINGILSNN